MAEKNLSSVIKWTASKLAGLIGSSSNSGYNPKDDVEELRKMVQSVRATIDYEEKRDLKYETVKLWLEELKHLAYDAEDIVDEYDSQVLRSKVEGRNKEIEATHKRKREEVCNLNTSTVSITHDFENTTEEYDSEVLQSKVEGHNRIRTTQKQKREEDALREDNEYFFEDELNIVDDEDNKDKESSEHNDVYEV